MKKVGQSKQDKAKRRNLKRRLFIRRARKYWLNKRQSILTNVFLVCLSGLVVLLAILGVGWVSGGEMALVEQASQMSLGRVFSGELVNWTYVLLAKGIFAIFGLGFWAIKLPNLLIAIGCLWLFNSVARQWLSRSVANLTTLLFATGIGFLTSALTADGSILYILYPLLIFWLINKISLADRKQPFIIALFVVGAVAVYTPYMVLILALAVLASFWHPKTRFFFAQAEKNTFFIGLITTVAILLPLIITIFFEPLILKTLFLPVDFAHSFTNLGQTMLSSIIAFRSGFFEGHLTPLFDLATFGLFILGMGQVIRNRYSY
ncbi:MAG: glycosyltransferase family 39 protein, partial [Candidatus Nomurabacteria bacterium]|nr:glycosyltransferase family 39 protein [Candidatus Nomurabacteria bacterium]